MKTLSAALGCIAFGLYGCMSVGPQDFEAAAAKYAQVRPNMVREEVIGLLGAPQSEDKNGSRWEIATSNGRQSAWIVVSFLPDGRVNRISRQVHAENTDDAVPIQIGPVATGG